MTVNKRGLHTYPDYLNLPKDMLKQLLVYTPFILPESKEGMVLVLYKSTPTKPLTHYLRKPIPESDIVLTHDDILELLTINYINPEDVYYYLKSKTK